MLIEPTTKKLYKKKQNSATYTNGKKYVSLYKDEVFYQIPNYPDYYVSQYSNVISCSKHKCIVRKGFYESKTGYTKLEIRDKYRGIHLWCADVWLAKPTFLDGCNDVKESDRKVEVHHIIPVKKNIKNQPPEINYACNLFPVYRKYHNAIEKIRSLKFLTDKGKWIRCDIRNIDDIAQYYEISLKELYDLIDSEPSYIDKKNHYYRIDDGKEIILSMRK